MAKRDGFWRWDRAKLAVEKGRQAYMDGKPQEANPYKRTFWGFGGYWDLGWMLAEADAKCEENMNTQNTQNVEMLQQINQFLAAMSPPDPDGMYSVAKVDSSVDPVELYRQGLAMGSGHVWYVGTKKVATAITGNGPRAKANAEFYAAAPVFVRWLLDQLSEATTRAEAVEGQLAKLQLDYIDTANGAVMERQRAETAEKERDALLWESDDGICGHCGDGAVRVSIDTQGYPYEVFAVRYCPVCHNAWVREEPVNPDASQM